VCNRFQLLIGANNDAVTNRRRRERVDLSCEKRSNRIGLVFERMRCQPIADLRLRPISKDTLPPHTVAANCSLAANKKGVTMT
jgi:hypothetical protein